MSGPNATPKVKSESVRIELVRETAKSAAMRSTAGTAVVVENVLQLSAVAPAIQDSYIRNARKHGIAVW